VAQSLQTKWIFDAHDFLDKDTFIVPDVYVRQCFGTYPDPANDYQRAKDFYLILLNKANSNWLPVCH